MRQGAAITGNLTHSSLFCPGLGSVLPADVVPTPLRRFLSSPSTSLAGRSPRWTEQTFLPWMFFCFCGKLKKKRRKNVWVHRCKNDCKEITHWEVYFLSAVKWIESQVFITLRWYCYKMAGLCFHFFRCGSLVKQQACVGGASWSSRVVWQLTGQQWLALCRVGWQRCSGRIWHHAHQHLSQSPSCPGPQARCRSMPWNTCNWSRTKQGQDRKEEKDFICVV